MKKLAPATIGVLLFLLVFVAPKPAGIKTVNADAATLIWGSTWNQQEPAVSYAEDTCLEIMDLFASVNAYTVKRCSWA